MRESCMLRKGPPKGVLKSVDGKKLRKWGALTAGGYLIFIDPPAQNHLALGQDFVRRKVLPVMMRSDGKCWFRLCSRRVGVQNGIEQKVRGSHRLLPDTFTKPRMRLKRRRFDGLLHQRS